MGGKGSGLRLFVRKGDQIHSLELSQGAQICPLLRDDDCEPFLEEDLAPELSLCEQDDVFAPALEKLLFYRAPCPQRESARSGETRSVLTRDQMPR